MPTAFLLLFLSFGLLIYSANLLVNGASSLANRFGVSHLMIGLTIVAFGTSLPELTINTLNSMKGHNEAVFGNIIGSNIFNLMLILGIVGMIYPIKVTKRSVAFEVPFSIVATLVLLVIINDHLWKGNIGLFGRIDGLIMLLLFGCFLIYLFLTNEKTTEVVTIRQRPLYLNILVIIIGLGLLVLAGYSVTDNAVKIAEYFGMSEKLVALTILSIGTSLPELATSAVAAYKKNPDIAIGNVIGSNLFNVSFILGISGLIHPAEYNAQLNTDVFVLLAGSFLLMSAMFTGGKMKLDRWEAALLFVFYIAYSVFIIHRN